MERFFGGLLSKLSSEYGIMAGVFTLALAISFSFNVRSFLALIKIHYLAWRRRSIPLSEHQMFNELSHIISHRLLPLNIHTNCIIRKNIYIDFMKERISNLQQCFRDFIKKDIERMNKRELYLEIRRMIEESDAKTCRDFSRNNRISANIMDKMQEKLIDTWKSYRTQIKVCCYGEYLYTSNRDRVSSIMDVIPYMIEHYMNILENALAEFNGEIKNLNYKGITCQNCKLCIHTEYLERLQDTISGDESTRYSDSEND